MDENERMVREAIGRFPKEANSYEMAELIGVSESTARRWKEFVRPEPGQEAGTIGRLNATSRDALKSFLSGKRADLTTGQKAAAFDALSAVFRSVYDVATRAPAIAPPASADAPDLKRKMDSRAVGRKARKAKSPATAEDPAPRKKHG